MKTNLLIMAALLLMITGYSLYANIGFYGNIAPKTEQKNITEKKVPNFTFTTLDGQSYDLHDFKGKAIVLNFWATWCSPCIIEFPQMLEMAENLQNEIVLVFLSADDRKTDIERFLKKIKKTHKKQLAGKNIFIAQDKDKKISQDLFQTFRLPETILISSDLIMKDKIIGADIKWNGKEMEKRLKEMQLGTL